MSDWGPRVVVPLEEPSTNSGSRVDRFDSGEAESKTGLVRI